MEMKKILSFWGMYNPKLKRGGLWILQIILKEQIITLWGYIQSMKRSTFPFLHSLTVHSACVHGWFTVGSSFTELRSPFSVCSPSLFTKRSSFAHWLIQVTFTKRSWFAHRSHRVQPFSFGTPTWKDCSKQWQSKEGSCAEGWGKTF